MWWSPRLPEQTRESAQLINGGHGPQPGGRIWTWPGSPRVLRRVCSGRLSWLLWVLGATELQALSDLPALAGGAKVSLSVRTPGLLG